TSPEAGDERRKNKLQARMRPRTPTGAAAARLRKRRSAMRSQGNTRDGIRELFLHRQASYKLSEVARLLGMTRGRLEREARADQEDAYRVNGRWRFTWGQVVYLALRQWSFAQIHNALGVDAAVLPPLLGLRALTVRLPEYLVRAIELSAAA